MLCLKESQLPHKISVNDSMKIEMTNAMVSSSLANLLRSHFENQPT